MSADRYPNSFAADVSSLDRTADLLRIAWHRAARFPPLPPLPRHKNENGHLVPTPPSTARQLSTAWLAVALWPIQVIGMTLQIRHIQHLDTASGTFRPVIGPPGAHRPAPTAAAVGIGAIYIAALFVAFDTAVQGERPTSLCSALLLLVAVIIPWIATAADVLGKRKEDPEGQRFPKSLAARGTELTPASGRCYVLTDFVAARDGTGDGVRLIQALAPGWTEPESVVVLYAATDDLVDYYRDQIHAEQDTPSRRRMVLHFRRPAHNSEPAGGIADPPPGQPECRCAHLQ